MRFPDAGRPEASFSEFVSLLTPARTVWETAIPKAGTEAGWLAEDYLDWWASDLRAAAARVAGVLGFCAGGVFASGLIERIAQFQPDKPPLILLDPERPTSLALYAQYHRGIELFGTVLDQTARDAMLTAGQELLARDDDVQVFGPALSDLYVRAGDKALASLGLNPARRAEFSAIFTAFVSWVVAAAQVEPGPQWEVGVCLSTVGHAAQAVGARRMIAVDAQHDDMLRDAGVARAVAELLAA